MEGEDVAKPPGFGFAGVREIGEQCWWFGGVNGSTPVCIKRGCGLELCFGLRKWAGVCLVCVWICIKDPFVFLVVISPRINVVISDFLKDLICQLSKLFERDQTCHK